MKIIRIRIEREILFKEIENKFNITFEELEKYNNNLISYKNATENAIVLRSNQEIKIPVVVPYKELTFDEIQQTKLTSKNRYRCEQINITQITSVLTSQVNQKTQYLLEQNLDKFLAKITLEDFVYEIYPPALSPSFELVKQTEFIKNNAYFELDEKGKIKNIINKDEIYKNWSNFRKTDFYKIPFIESLLNVPHSLKQIEDAGELQFKNLDLEEYKRNLFNFVCFDQFLYQIIERLEIEEFIYPSTLFPSVIIPIEFKFNKVKEDKDIITLKKSSTVNLTDDIKNTIKELYDKHLKKEIKYAFTEYKLFFSVIIDFNTKEQCIENASIKIREEIADNIENICEFSLSRLHNFVPEN